MVTICRGSLVFLHIFVQRHNFLHSCLLFHRWSKGQTYSLLIINDSGFLRGFLSCKRINRWHLAFFESLCRIRAQEQMLAPWLLRQLGVMTSFVSELCVSGLLPHAWNCLATCSLASSVKSQTLYSLNNLYPHWEDGPALQKTFERRQCLSHVLQEVMEMKGLLVGEWQVNSRNRRMHATAWSGWALWLQVIVSPVSSPLGNKLIFR